MKNLDFEFRPNIYNMTSLSTKLWSRKQNFRRKT